MYNLKKLVKAILDKIGGTAMGTTATTSTVSSQGVNGLVFCKKN